MNPNIGENLQIIIDPKVRNTEKLERLELSEAQGIFDKKQRLESLTARAKALAEPFDDGISDVVRPGHKPVNFDAAERKISETDNGDITLSFFVYAPEHSEYGRSIYAAWYLKTEDSHRLLLEEFVSDKSLIPDISAYNPAAGKVLELLEESIDLYEQAG